MSNSQDTFVNLLKSFGFTKEEYQGLLESNDLRGNSLEVRCISVEKEWLLSHILFQFYFRGFNKHLLSSIIKEYQSNNILNKSIHQEILNKINEEVEELFWGMMEDENDSAISNSYVSTKVKQDYRNLISGIMSSVLSRTFVAPLDRLKLLYQVNYIGHKKTPSIYHGLLQIYQTDGMKGFFKGNLVNNMKGSPENGIKFYTYEIMKQTLQKYNGERLSNFQLFYLGSVSGLISTTIMFPLEVIKVRLSTAPKGFYSGIFDVFSKVIREPKGVLNLYSGIEASACMAIPNAGLNLAFYEKLKIYFSGSYSSNNGALLSFTSLMLIGGISAVATSIFLYPFQLTQSRMIIYNLKSDELRFNSSFIGRPFLQSKFVNIIHTTYKLDGFSGFYKGFVPGAVKIFFGNGLGYGIYEKARKVLGVSE